MQRHTPVLGVLACVLSFAGGSLATMAVQRMREAPASGSAQAAREPPRPPRGTEADDDAGLMAPAALRRPLARPVPRNEREGGRDGGARPRRGETVPGDDRGPGTSAPGPQPPPGPWPDLQGEPPEVQEAVAEGARRAWREARAKIRFEKAWAEVREQIDLSQAEQLHPPFRRDSETIREFLKRCIQSTVESYPVELRPGEATWIAERWLRHDWDQWLPVPTGNKGVAVMIYHFGRRRLEEVVTQEWIDDHRSRFTDDEWAVLWGE